MVATDRRGFLKHGLVAAGGLGLGLTAWSRLANNGNSPGFHSSLGPLIPVNDQSTGLPLLKLPKRQRVKHANVFEEYKVQEVEKLHIKYPLR